MAKTIRQKDINLLAALEKASGSSAEAVKRRNMFVLLLGAVALIVIGALLYFFTVMGLNNEKETYLAYIDDPQIRAAYNDAREKSNVTSSMVNNAQWLQELITTIDGYPDMNTKKFSQVEDYAKKRVRIIGVEYDDTSGALTFKGETESATSVPIFVNQLRTSGLFDDVAYEGYTDHRQEQPMGTSLMPYGSIAQNNLVLKTYLFNVSCQLMAGD